MCFPKNVYTWVMESFNMQLRMPQVGFKMFLNTSAAVANWNADSTECSLVSSQPSDIKKALKLATDQKNF